VRLPLVAVTVGVESTAQPDRIFDALRSLQHGSWSPPLDELVDAAHPAAIQPKGPTAILAFRPLTCNS